MKLIEEKTIVRATEVPSVLEPHALDSIENSFEEIRQRHPLPWFIYGDNGLVDGLKRRLFEDYEYGPVSEEVEIFLTDFPSIVSDLLATCRAQHDHINDLEKKISDMQAEKLQFDKGKGIGL